MDVASAVDDGFGEGFAGAGTAVEDVGGGGESGEIFLNDVLVTDVLAIDCFVLEAEIGPILCIGGLQWLRVFHDGLNAKWLMPRKYYVQGLCIETLFTTLTRDCQKRVFQALEVLRVEFESFAMLEISGSPSNVGGGQS